MYHFLANLVVLIHTLLVMGFILGTLLAVLGLLQRWRGVERAFFVVLAIGWLWFMVTHECPLTELEHFLRAKVAPESVYQEGCITHYLGRIGIEIADQTVLRIGFVLLAMVLVATLFWHTRAFYRSRCSRTRNEAKGMRQKR